jgi:DNA-binding MarR family transcriptional regulator
MSSNSIDVFQKIFIQFGRELHKIIKENKDSNLRIIQRQILLVIDEKQPVSPASVAEILNMDRGNVSKIVHGLIELGLLTRKEKKTDKRFMSLNISSQGKKIVRGIKQKRNNYFEGIFKLIPEKDHENVIHYFDILTQAITKYNNNLKHKQ